MAVVPAIIPEQGYAGDPIRLQVVDSGNTDYEGKAVYTPVSSTTTTAAASEVHVGEVGGKTKPVQGSFTRPGDANAYTANDAVANSTSAPTAITLTGAARITGGSGYIVALTVIHEVVSVTPRFRVHFYDANPATRFNDNAVFANTYAIESASSYLGYMDTAAANSNGLTDASIGQNITDRFPFKCNADANLYCLVQTLDAFTPGNAKGVTVKALCEQN